MISKIKQFIDWLNTDDLAETDKPKERTDSNAPQIEQALRALKRSGLAMPFELWPDFVVDVVDEFDRQFPQQTAAMLNVAIYAMRIRRNYVLPPDTPPEDVIHREIVWVYGVFVAVVLHHADMSLLQMSQIFSADAQLAVTSDKELCESIEQAVKDVDSDTVISEILRQALAANCAMQRGASKDEINAAAEAGKAATGKKPVQKETATCDKPKETAPISKASPEIETTGSRAPQKEEINEDLMKFMTSFNEPAYTNARKFLQHTSEHIHVLDDGSTFYALPAFTEFSEVLKVDKAVLIAEFEELTGLSATREKLKNGRHKGYKKQ